MSFADVKIPRNVTEKDIEEAEQDLAIQEDALKELFGIQADQEKNGVDLNNIGISAAKDIGIIGEAPWLGIKREKLEEFCEDIKEAKKKIRKAKERLKIKQEKRRRKKQA